MAAILLDPPGLPILANTGLRPRGVVPMSVRTRLTHPTLRRAVDSLRR